MLPPQIARVGRDRDRALVFRGWSRLCLHAGSLSAAEGASAAATAAARAAYTEAMEAEDTAAAEKAKAWKREAAASADVAAARGQAAREMTGASKSATELERREEVLGQELQQERKRRAMILVRHYGTWYSPYSSSSSTFVFRGNILPCEQNLHRNQRRPCTVVPSANAHGHSCSKPILCCVPYLHQDRRRRPEQGQGPCVPRLESALSARCLTFRRRGSLGRPGRSNGSGGHRCCGKGYGEEESGYCRRGRGGIKAARKTRGRRSADVGGRPEAAEGCRGPGASGAARASCEDAGEAKR